MLSEDRHDNPLVGRNLPKIDNRRELITFSSYSEYAAGVLLEKYIPNFEIRPGQTFQVPIGHGKSCDFFVNGVFVEYHPCTISHEFDDRQALRKFHDALRHVKDHIRQDIISAIADELSEKYYIRRKFLVSMHGGKDAELIVAKSATELYRQVIKRFSDGAPKEAEFVREFRQLSGQRTVTF